MTSRCGNTDAHRGHYVSEGNDTWWCRGAEAERPSGLTPGGSCRVYPDTGPEMPGAVTLRERLSEAIGAQTHHLAADAALTVCATWLREQAETAEVHDTDRAVMRYLAEWIEEGKA